MAGETRKAGLLPRQELVRLMAEGAVTAASPILDAQIQPASLDLRLGPKAYRLRASFLPGRGAPSNSGCRPSHSTRSISPRAPSSSVVASISSSSRRNWRCRGMSPARPTQAKSSTGRLDVFSRVISDAGGEFDRVPAGYRGALYAEISPRTFSVVVRAGSRLNQARFRRGRRLGLRCRPPRAPPDGDARRRRGRHRGGPASVGEPRGARMTTR